MGRWPLNEGTHGVSRAREAAAGPADGRATRATRITPMRPHVTTWSGPMRASRRRTKAAVVSSDRCDQVRTKPLRTKKKETPVEPWMKARPAARYGERK